MEFLAGILIIVLLVRWVVLSNRLRDIEQHLTAEAKSRGSNQALLEDLARRVGRLEAGPSPVPIVAPEPAPRVVAIVEPPSVPLQVTSDPAVRVCQFCGRKSSLSAAVCACGAALIAPAEKPAEPPPLPAEPPPIPEPVPIFATVTAAAPPAIPRDSWQDRMRKQVGDQGWEAMVGGSWLNKVGVLVLVIGMALLLAYEFSRVGPGGRVAIGMGVSLTLLIGGVLIERRPVYAIFARGLIGGGWAALYFTTYAMHAVAAARVIDNAFVATGLLLAVAGGMILHSLWYRSQTISGLAYFIAFATLALAESTPFSVLALIPLAGSLLVLAYRFEWTTMAIFGLVATYATCASRPDTGAPLASTQALFVAYWLMFEVFDLMRLRRRAAGFTVESLILPLNSLGFLGLSLVKWQRSSPELLYAALAAGAVLFLLSALVRVWLAPAGFRETGDTLRRMAAGGFEGPITVAAVLAACGIFEKATGVWVNLGLLIEGEILLLAGVGFGETYLRGLAGGVFAASLVKLTSDVIGGNKISIAQRQWMAWTPVTLLSAVVFYANRAMKVLEGRVYSTAAAALIVLVLGFETPPQYLGAAWLGFAVLLFELGFRTEHDEFLLHSYGVGAIGIVAGLRENILAVHPEWQQVWLPMAISAALLYAVTLRIRFGRAERLKEAGQGVSWVASIAAAGFLMAIAWKLAPGEYLGVAWLGLGTALFELGVWRLPEAFRRLSYFVFAAGFLNLFCVHVFLVRKDSAAAEAFSLGIATLLCWGLSARVFRAMADRIPDQEREWARDLFAAAGALFALTLAWLKLPAPVVALAWAVVSIVLLEIGFSFALSRFRLVGNIVAAAVFGRLFLANFTDLGNTVHISHRMLTVVPIAISQYYVWARYRRAQVEGWERNWVRLYLYAPAILGVALFRFELGRSLAVVGWALLGLALYKSGLHFDIRDLRWQSHVLAILVFWRCWNTNFYIPESLAGMRGRVLTGAVVIACFYAAQLFSPRDSGEPGRRGVDRYARTFYSLLGSVLLAVLLFYEVSGSVLTMAWGVEAVALLAGGFLLRDRVQRLSGLLLFMVCVLKLFLYDLRQLETINRIISFIVLGVILVVVSWIYTRFRDRIQRYL